MSATSLRRLPAYSAPVLSILALAAVLAWLFPADPAQAQNDPAGPRITAGPAIASSPASGDTYRAGEQITVTLTFGQPVAVTGKPRLGVIIGDQRRWAGYESAGADGATLYFTHAVKPDDADDDGIRIRKNALRLNGGTIADADGNAARLNHPALPNQAGHKVNGAPDEPEPTPTPTPEPEPPANNEPQFTDETAARSVDENTAAGTVVGDPVTAGDDDGDALTYALSGADAGAFDLDTASGQIQVKDALDYEAKASYTLTVTVHDGKDTAGEADASEDDTIEVTIAVLNLDEPGVVALDTGEPAVGTAVTASLSDPDGGITGLAWSWERSADGSQWTAIAGATAAAYTPANDDDGQYLRATASYADGEGSGKSAQAGTVGAVAAAITDEPPSVIQGPVLNSPAVGDTYGGGEQIVVTLTFSEPVTVSGTPRLGVIIGENRRWARYSESASGGATLVFSYTVQAADRDDDGIRIRKNALRLNGGSIADVGGNAAGLEHPAVAARSSHQVNGAASPKVEATNAAPTFGEDARTTRSVDENTAANANIGGAVAATDANDDTLTYSLGGTDAAAFNIVETSGQLQTKDALDYETKTSYSVTVSVHDGKAADGSASTALDDSIDVTINVGNVDEVGSVIFDSAAPAVGTALTATVEDPDGSVSAIGWVWKRADTQGGNFTEITGATNASYTPVGTDRSKWLKATATYTDGQGGGKTARSTAVAVVAAPSFKEGDTATRSVPENTPKGIRVGAAVAATTPNEGDTLTYALAGADAAAFRIDENTGQLRFAKAPDFEQPADQQSTTPANAAANNQYVVNVTVTDGKDSAGNAEATPVVDDTIMVTVSVTDEDEPGRLTLSTTRPQLGSTVTATVSDPDGGVGATTWRWERSTGRTTWSVISGAASASYTPVAADAGRFLRVTATYNDSFGNGKQVESRTTEVVRTHALSQLEITTTSAKKMYPAFDAATLHYAVGCQKANSPAKAKLTVTLAAADPSTRVAVNGVQHTSDEHTFTLRPATVNDKIEITLSGSTGASSTYVVHCLDNEIREIKTTKKAGATGIIEELMIFSAAPNVMVIDNNGVPRWYASAGSAGPFFRYFELKDGSRRYFYSRPTSHADTDTLGSDWYELDDDFNHVDLISTVGGLKVTDTHDIILTEDGQRYVVLSYEPAKRDFSSLTTKYGVRKYAQDNALALNPGEAGYDAGVALGTAEDTDDAVIQMRTPNQTPKDKNKKGTQEWVWNSWGYLPVADCVQNPTPYTFPGDYPHINSVELLPDGDFIASFRGCSTVVRIDRATGNVVWRLGRTNLTDAEWKALDDAGNGQGQKPLKILDDPYGEFCGQHAAYLLANGNLFVFDNGVGCVEDPRTGRTVRKNNVFSRVIEYALDPENGEAVFQRHHSLHNSFNYLGYFSGHQEELDNGDWLVSWGGIGQGLRTRFGLPDTALTPDHSTTQVDPDTKEEKFSITIGDPPTLIEDIRAIPLSPVALAANIQPLAATILASAGSATHAGASDSPTVVVAFNQPVVDIDKATPSVTVTGATVASVAPHIEAGKAANAYVFTLTPTGNSAITFNLAASQSCASASKGICTASGGQLTATLTKAHTISYVAGADTTAPTVASVTITSTPAAHDSYAPGETITMEVTFSEPVSVTGEPCLLINVGSLLRPAAYASGSGSTRLRFNYTVVTGDRDRLGIGAFNFDAGRGPLQLSCSEGGAAGTIRDAAENDADLLFRLLWDDGKHKVGGPDVIADRTPPTITDLAVVSSPASGDTYRDGETIKVQVTFSEPVVAVRWPRVAIWIGYDRKELTYREGTSTNKLTFGYEVQSGDRDNHGISILSSKLPVYERLDWPSITDSADNFANVKHQLMDDQPGHKVAGSASDATAPTVKRVSVSSAPGPYIPGQKIKIFAMLSEGVLVTGTPYLELSVGGKKQTVAYHRVNEDAGGFDVVSFLPFYYTVTVEDANPLAIEANSVKLPEGANIRDLSTNDVDLAHDAVGELPRHKIFRTHVVDEGVSITSTPADGDTYRAGETIRVSVRFNRKVTVTGVPTLLVVMDPRPGDHPRARYSGGSGTDTLTFDHVVVSGDRDWNGIEVNYRWWEGPIVLDDSSSIKDEDNNDALLENDRVGTQTGHKVDGGG